MSLCSQATSKVCMQYNMVPPLILNYLLNISFYTLHACFVCDPLYLTGQFLILHRFTCQFGTTCIYSPNDYARQPKDASFPKKVGELISMQILHFVLPLIGSVALRNFFRSWQIMLKVIATHSHKSV